MAGGTSTSSFTITVNLTDPTSGMKISYFLIVIKAQTTQVYIDLVHFGNYLFNKKHGAQEQTLITIMAITELLAKPLL